MARLSKRKRRKPEETLAPKKPFTRKNEIWLVSFIIVNLLVLGLGLQSMDTPSLAMYTLLVLTLISIYIKRKFPIPERVERYLDTFGATAIGVALVFFLYVCYQKFIA